MDIDRMRDDGKGLANRRKTFRDTIGNMVDGPRKWCILHSGKI